jgi:hypothetical protein
MGETVPSFYHVTEIGGDPLYDGEAFGNFLLRSGEVKKVILPTDPKSRSKKFLEYDVYVQHRENGTATNKIYHNCRNVNSLCGLADKTEFTLRIDDTQKTTGDASITKGFGSKVLLLCLGGEHTQAIILGGLRDDQDKDDIAEGHHHTFVFNGTTIKVQDDGSYSIQVDGKTRADGQPHKNRAGGGGSSIKVEANGDIVIATKDNKQAIIINNQNGTVHVAADKDIVVNGTKIHIGEGAVQKAVLGDQLKSLLEQTLSLIGKMTAGLTDPMLAASSMAQATILSTTVSTILSKTVTIKN